jgi:hypothetical protein
MVMGDFFDNQLIAGPSHLKYIIVENGLYQAISEPTYFCKNSSFICGQRRSSKEDPQNEQR